MKYTRYLIFLLLLCSGLTGCIGGNSDKSDEESVEALQHDETNRVTVQLLESVPFHQELISNGKLTAERMVDLFFENDEPVAVVYVKNGERVQKDQKLARLNSFKLENNLSKATTSLENARLELQDLLIGQGFRIQDSALVPPAVMQLVEIKSGYKQALDEYNLARYEADHAVLTAPFDGVVANLYTRAMNKQTAGEPFCTIIDPNSLEASFSVLESELPLIRRGDVVEITPFALTDVKSRGTISEINPLVDKDGMVRVKADVQNRGNLFEGMNVKVSVQRSAGRQLVVPKEAVVMRSGRQVVFTLKEDKAFWNYVQTGLENAGYYTITEGLQPGDVVITSGSVDLAHDAPVVVIEQEQTD